MYHLNIYSMEGKGREMMSVRKYMERGKEYVGKEDKIVSGGTGRKIETGSKNGQWRKWALCQN